MSISRGRRSFTGRPVLAAASAAAPATHEALLSLPPKPPPRRRTTVVTRLKSQPSIWAQTCCTSVGCWVEECTIHVAVLARQGEGDLAFEIEVLLPADAELARSACAARTSARHRGRRAAGSTAPGHRPAWPAPCRYRGSPRRARSRSPRARRRRARHRASSATTIASGWPANSTRSRRTTARPCRRRAMSLWPGMSPAASTATTPGRRRRREIELAQAAGRDGAQHQRGMQGAGRLGMSSI